MKQVQTKTKKPKQKGFTIVEMLISIGLFVTVITVTSAAFLVGLRAQRQIISILNANDNASYAMEVMSRDIRMGKTFFSPLSEILTFLNYKGEAVVYRLNNNAIERSIAGDDFQTLTASNVRVLRLDFHVTGEKRFDNEQTRITITIQISTKYGAQEVITNLQTTISPRELET